MNLIPRVSIAIDPGGTTGIAVYKYCDEEQAHTCNPDNVTTQTLPPTEVLKWLDSQYIHNRIVSVAAERFITAGRLSKFGLLTIELYASILGWCHAKGILFYTQNPTTRKPYQHIAEDIFPKWEKRIVHENDALAHLLLHLETAYKISF